MSILMNPRRLRVSFAITAAAMLITSCASSPAALDSAIPTPARATVGTESASGTNGATSSSDLKRTSKEGNVTLEVTWEKGGASASASLLFKVVMDTHSVDLDVIDLMQLAKLRNDTGKEVSPERWDAPAGGHHRSGTIVFPATVAGSALIDAQTKFIRLVVRDVAGVKERSFKWEVSS